MAIFTGDRRRHADFNAMRTTNLFALHRHRYRTAEDNQVVEDPGHTDEDGQDFVFRAVEVTPDTGDDANDIQQSREIYDGEITQSTYSSSTRPPFAVTLNFPLCGFISATIVGGAMYQASTVS